MSTNTGQVAERIKDSLARIRFRLDEKDLQASMAACFEYSRLRFEREFKCCGGFVDFFVEGAAVEVKVAGTAAAVAKQLTRYLADDIFAEGIVVATKPMRISVSHLAGKPLTVIELWKQFL